MIQVAVRMGKSTYCKPQIVTVDMEDKESEQYHFVV